MNTNYKELKKLCTTFKKGFEDIKQFAWDWGHSKKPITKVMEAILRSGPAQIAREYEIQSSHLYLLSEVFQDAKAMKQIQAKHGSELTPAGLEALSFWEKNPGFWCYFSIKEHLGGNFYVIDDHIHGKEHILYSPGLLTMQKWKDAEQLHFLCMMLANPQCLQTIGIIKYYRLPVSDFLFYCSLFTPEEGLKAILHTRYIQFFRLDTINSALPLTRGDYHIDFIWHSFTLPEFDITKMGGIWLSPEGGSHQRFTLSHVDSSMKDLPNFELFTTATAVMVGSIVRDHITGEMAIFTNTEVAYAFFFSLLNRAYPELKLAKKPLTLISLPLQLFLAGMDLPLPWKKFSAIMEYRESEETMAENRKQDWEDLKQKYANLPGVDPQVQFTKDFVEVLGVALQAGNPVDIEEAYKGAGLDKSTVERLIHAFSKEPESSSVDKVYDEMAENDDEEDMGETMVPEEYAFYVISDKDKVYEMDGRPMLDDLYGETFQHSLPDSSIFVIDITKMEKAHRQFLQLVSDDYAMELEQYGMLRSIDRLFSHSFDEELAYPLMNTFFWILLHKGNEWILLRSYAIEILKWIPSDILPFYSTQDEFIEAFSKFVKRLLCTRGVCSLAKRPTAEEITQGLYPIKGSDALFTLLQVRDFDE